MRKRRKHKVYVPGLWQRLWERLRGESVRVVKSHERLPVLVLRFARSRGSEEAADSLETAYRNLLAVIEPNPIEVYQEVLPQLPGTVAVLLRERDPGGCLGHARMPGLESRFARNLAAETGQSVGEIDLSWRLIAEWEPRPLASRAISPATLRRGDLRYRLALLTVLFHELEHLAFPDRPEQEVRQRSDRFYDAVLAASARDFGESYGMDASSSSRP